MTSTMTQAAKNVLIAFNALPNKQQREVLINLLRIPIEADYKPLSDNQLRHLADNVFLELDKREES